tara:strand:+ start:49 stop:219 length:171 start_codon:yes stop_codon:yes gene_type:complete
MTGKKASGEHPDRMIHPSAVNENYRFAILLMVAGTGIRKDFFVMYVNVHGELTFPV